MANIKSAIKRIKIANTKTMQNKSIKSNIKTAIKKFEAAIDEGDLDNARALYQGLVVALTRQLLKVSSTRMQPIEKSQLALRLQAAQNQE